MKILLIINPAAGGGKPVFMAEKIAAMFKRRNIKIDIVKTEKKGHGTKLAKEAVRKRYNVVIAMGGEGTINEVLNGIVKTKVKLGIIPLGTENIMATELGIPFDPIQACKVILKGKTKMVDVGRVNNRYFLTWATIGYQADAIHNVERGLLYKMRSGQRFFNRISVILSGAFALLSKPMAKLSITIGKNKHRVGYSVFIGNIQKYGGNFQVAPYAKIDDGYLDLCILQRKDLIENLKYFVAGYDGKHIYFEGVEYHKIKKARIVSFDPAMVQVDGDSMGTTPVEVKVAPKSLRVIVP